MLKLVDPASQEVPVRQFTPSSTDLEQTKVPVKDLSRGAQMVVWSIRHWVRNRQQGRPAGHQLDNAYRLAGIPEASDALDESMTLLARLTLRKIVVHCPCSKQLSCDEFLLLQMIRSLQNHQRQAAEARAGRLLQGRMRRTFCRVLEDYAISLTGADLHLGQISRLKMAMI